MTEHELRELDAFCATDVMGWKEVRFLSYYGKGKFMVSRETGELMVYDLKGESFSPTTDPAASMQVLERCIEESEGYQIQIDSGFSINWGKGGCSVHALTLPLAIALFAKKLFSTP